MHSQAALTIREWQRQELLIDAEHARRIKQLASVNPGETSRTHHQIVALRSWLRQRVTTLSPTPRPAPQLVTH